MESGDFGLRIADIGLGKLQSDQIHKIIPQSKIPNPQSNHSSNPNLFKNKNHPGNYPPLSRYRTVILISAGYRLSQTNNAYMIDNTRLFLSLGIYSAFQKCDPKYGRLK